MLRRPKRSKNEVVAPKEEEEWTDCIVKGGGKIYSCFVHGEKPAASDSQWTRQCRFSESFVFLPSTRKQSKK